jgi:hypothetical protein
MPSSWSEPVWFLYEPMSRAPHRVFQLLVTADIAASSLILSTLMIEAIRSSQTTVLTTATLGYIPYEGILYSHCRGNLKHYEVRIPTFIERLQEFGEIQKG